MTQRLVLDSSPDFVEGAVGEFHDVERVRDLSGVWQCGVERGAVGPREVQCRPTDLRPPLLGPFGQPAHRRFGGAAWDYVDELAPPDVDDVGGPGLGPIPAAAREQGLVEPQRLHRAYPVGISGEQR